MTPPDTDPVPIGKLATEWVKRAHAAWQRGAARDPDRFLYLPEAVPSAAGQVQRRWLGVLGGRSQFATWRLSNVTGHVADRVETVETWLDKGKAKPLLIEGRESGTGKTALACATAYAWWQGGARPVTFARVGELLDPEPEVRQRLARAGELTLVVLDDLTSVTAAWQSFTDLTEQLRARGARLITTTNMVASDRRDPAKLDPRVRRRLCDDAVVVPMPETRLDDDPPGGPSLDPCPYGCANGWLVAEDAPGGYEAAETFAADRHYAQPGGADAEASGRAFDALLRTLAVPCPHCSVG